MRWRGTGWRWLRWLVMTVEETGGSTGVLGHRTKQHELLLGTKESRKNKLRKNTGD